MARFGGPNGYGHVDEGAGQKLTPIHHLFVKEGVDPLGSTPSARSLRKGGPTQCFDQGQTSSCVGHAIVGAIFTTLGQSPATCLDVPPSMDQVYKLARLIDAPHAPLVDQGSSPSQAIRALSEYGVEPMKARPADGRYSDVDPATVNRPLTLGELVASAEFKITGQYGLDASAPGFVGLVRAAICAGYAVNFSIFCDTVGPRSVEGWDPSTGPLGAPDASDPKGGGHDLYCDGYHETADGQTIAEFPNSWGKTSWGVDGYGEGDEAFMASWSNVFVIKVVRL